MVHRITATDDMAAISVSFPGEKNSVGLFVRRKDDGAVSVHVSGNGPPQRVDFDPPKPPMERVAVAFTQEFDSPSEAADYAEWGSTYTYEAPASMKLTIGDRVLVPVGANLLEREATVVRLNAKCPVGYIKTVAEKLS